MVITRDRTDNAEDLYEQAPLGNDAAYARSPERSAVLAGVIFQSTCVFVDAARILNNSVD
jgi:hypothetical protein